MMKEDRNWFYWNDLPNGIPNDISVLTEEDINKILAEWRKAVWTKNTQDDKQKLKNIKELPAIDIKKVEEWVMDRLKEAADHYVNGFWLSCISLCESICEFISYFFLERYICSEGIDKIIEHNKKLQDQGRRLQLLKELSVISDKEWELLDKVRDIRNKYIHLNKIDFEGHEIKDNSLIVIKNLIQFLNQRVPSQGLTH
jgi:hypothetical protein